MEEDLRDGWKGKENLGEKGGEREKHSQILLINIVVRLWPLESIERGGSSDCISTHVVKIDKIAKVQFWKGSITDFVQTITCWTPKAGWVEAL